ncbi:homocysteine s-methyltransferase 3 [Phtheirospermum japonicum]|uniref:Homocysteine s-methyltransferase 3 n=1 Tax=Phtheirospermum japonicum TaxID=374723 RepID=A0A830BFN9_9LAMI|nr:homocysteine s-methyltransferase 3 [Phtheirospermum japonicum]
MVLKAVVRHHPSSFMTSFLRQCGGSAVIDGGLATELERHGANLNDPLWSAKCLMSSPHLIRRGTLQGFEAKGLSRKEGEALLEKSVKIACEARDIYYDRATKGSWDVSGNGTFKQRPILVAASVGSYGAYLADGSEYSGIYGDNISLETLKDFHRRRVQVLAESGADLIAFETIPNKLEAKAFVELLEEEGISIPAWLSFTSNDGTNAASGDSIEDCALIADSCEQVTTKPILIYPNSGETYDANTKEWVPSTGVADVDFVSYVGKWREAGASLIGGPDFGEDNEWATNMLLFCCSKHIKLSVLLKVSLDVEKSKENVTVTVRFHTLSPREIRQGEVIAWYADGDTVLRNEHNLSIAYAYGKKIGQKSKIGAGCTPPPSIGRWLVKNWQGGGVLPPSKTDGAGPVDGNRRAGVGGSVDAKILYWTATAADGDGDVDGGPLGWPIEIGLIGRG